MNALVYPLTFNPIFKDYPWGGRNLGEKLNRQLPDGVVAESWEVAAHPNGSSIVNRGPLAGKSLDEVQKGLGVALLGTRNEAALARGKFPLLVKLLDANAWLSVQVHPDDEYAETHAGEWGKTEMWVVLHAQTGSEIILGFKRGVTKARFAQAIAEGRTEEWLHRLPVDAGTVIFVPSGLIHALGPGLIVAEIQQNSDVTYRVYDWSRDRPLHIEDALAVLDFSQVEPAAVEPITLVDDEALRVEQLAACDYFETERIALTAGSSFYGLGDGETFEIWGVLSGEVTLTWAGEPLTLASVTWVLLPAELGEFQITGEQESLLLRVITP